MTRRSEGEVVDSSVAVSDGTVATSVVLAVVAAIGLFVFFSAGVGVVAANNETVVRGSPDLDVQPQDSQYEPGADGTLDLTISNDGTIEEDNQTHPEEAIDRATEARSVQAEVTDTGGTPITVESGPQSLGTIESGENTAASFDIVVDDDAEPGSYEVGVTLDYQDADPVRYSRNEADTLEYNETINDRQEIVYVDVEVEEQPEFAIQNVDHAVQIDESGNLTVDLENVGTEDVTDAVVTANAPDQDISLGTGGTASDRYVGDWGANEDVQLTYRLTASDAAVAEPYPITFDVQYTDSEGQDAQTTLETSITPQGRQQYVIEGVSHDISIGDSDILTVAVRNTGPKDVENASVTIAANDPAITFEQGSGTTETFVGNWNAGETKQLQIRTAVGDEAVEREYALEATVSARDTNDNNLNARSREFGFVPEPMQDYTVRAVDHDIVIGDQGVLAVTLTNDGPRSLRNATVSLNTNDPALTFGEADGGSTTTTTFVGEWPAGENRTIRVGTAASNDAIARSYTFEASITGVDRNGSELDARTTEFGVEPLPRQQYVVENVTHTVPVDDSGILTVTIRNTGPLNVTDASVTVSANDQAIVFGSGGSGDAVQFEDVAFETGGGGAPQSEAFVGDWEAGETRTVRYQAGVTAAGLQRNYTLDLSVDARDEAGRTLSTRTRQFGFEPRAEQSFAIDGMEASLRVGEDGDLVGTVTNTGTRAARNVVVLYNSDMSNIFPRATQYAVGDLAPGESAEFRFRIGVSEEAEPGPRLFQFQPRYRNHEGESRLGDSQDVLAPVESQRNAFDFEAVNATFAAGGSDALELRVENQLNETVENVRIKLFPDAPLSSSKDEGFVEELAPGESTTVDFKLSVEGGATPATYPLELDVRYDDARGDRQLSGTYQEAVTVTESEGGGFPLLLIGGLALALVGVGVVFRGRLVAAGEALGDRLG
jgi:hypothetical protein